MKQKRRSIAPLVIFILLLCLAVIAFFYFYESRQEQAMHTVQQFYEYQQEGEYADAWEMLHPLLKNELPQTDFFDKKVQWQQALEINAFKLSIENVEALDRWRMNERSPYVYEVFCVEAVRQVNGVFGKMSIHKNIYVTKQDGQWRILWSYNNS